MLLPCYYRNNRCKKRISINCWNNQTVYLKFSDHKQDKCYLIWIVVFFFFLFIDARIQIVKLYRRQYNLKMLSFVLFTLLGFSGTLNADFSDETKTLISDWAPLIWIHSEDPFLPSNVDFYLDNMEVSITLLNEI